MRVGRQRKDPNSISIHTIDWSKWLTKRSSDTISSVAWTYEGGLDVGAVEQNTTTTASTTIAALGTVGDVHEITCRITTTNGLIEDAVLLIAITEE